MASEGQTCISDALQPVGSTLMDPDLHGRLPSVVKRPVGCVVDRLLFASLYVDMLLRRISSVEDLHGVHGSKQVIKSMATATAGGFPPSAGK